MTTTTISLQNLRTSELPYMHGASKCGLLRGRELYGGRGQKKGKGGVVTTANLNCIFFFYRLCLPNTLAWPSFYFASFSSCSLLALSRLSHGASSWFPRARDSPALLRFFASSLLRSVASSPSLLRPPLCFLEKPSANHPQRVKPKRTTRI